MSQMALDGMREEEMGFTAFLHLKDFTVGRTWIDGNRFVHEL